MDSLKAKGRQLTKERLRGPYQYSPLNEGSNEIRLLTLHSGVFTAKIEVSIHTVSLVPDNPPIYEALSYVWGSMRNMTSIKANSDSLAVTRGLAVALPYLRYVDKPRILWIDAICVNQQDLEERGRQVKRMADIYRLAHRVVVWLGPASKTSSLGLGILEHLNSQIEIDWIMGEMKLASTDSEAHWSDRNEELPYNHDDVLAIEELLSRSWFERLWVQQEIRLANDYAIFMCGLDIITWRSLRKAIRCLFYKVSLSSRLQDRVEVINALTFAFKELSLLDIRQQTQHCKCLDPRDRVYAILSLVSNNLENSLDIEPDYAKTTGQVYQDMTLRHIIRHKSLGILRSCGSKKLPSELPTWVPDWRVASTARLLPGTMVSGFSQSVVQHEDAGVLSVTGIHGASVQQVKKIAYSGVNTLVAEIQRIAPDDILRASYAGGGSLLAAYCRTTSANLFREMSLPHTNILPLSQQSLDFFSSILQPPRLRTSDYDFNFEARSSLNLPNYFLESRSLIETREGYIGLAPPTASPGDQVCMLLGCKVPLLLRPTGNHHFQVVGECYVHGLSDGEAFLGPLPDPYQLVQVLDEKTSGYYWRFRNYQTGEIQVNDPRLGFTPKDEDYELLTPEMIEKRGVKLRTFDLI